MLHIITNLDHTVNIQKLTIRGAEKSGLDQDSWRESKKTVYNLEAVQELNKFLGRTKVVYLGKSGRDVTKEIGLSIVRQQTIKVEGVKDYVEKMVKDSDSAVILVDTSKIVGLPKSVESLVMEVDSEVGLTKAQIEELSKLAD